MATASDTSTNGSGTHALASPGTSLLTEENNSNVSVDFDTSYRQHNVSTFVLHGVPIVSLFIDGKERLCLAQISNTLLKDYSYNEIHNRRVALGITCVQCTPVQLEILRRSGAMAISSRRCGMITKREAERLVKSFLEEHTPPKLPDNFSFRIKHTCGYGCFGLFIPSRYNSSRAKCIKCTVCNLFLSPNKFIFHFHRMSESSYRHPDAANFNSWRRHLNLDYDSPSDALVHAWEDVKAMFNGGSRKRVLSPTGGADIDTESYRETPKHPCFTSVEESSYSRPLLHQRAFPFLPTPQQNNMLFPLPFSPTRLALPLPSDPQLKAESSKSVVPWEAHPAMPNICHPFGLFWAKRLALYPFANAFRMPLMPYEWQRRSIRDELTTDIGTSAFKPVNIPSNVEAKLLHQSQFNFSKYFDPLRCPSNIPRQSTPTIVNRTPAIKHISAVHDLNEEASDIVPEVGQVKEEDEVCRSSSPEGDSEISIAEPPPKEHQPPSFSYASLSKSHCHRDSLE